MANNTNGFTFLTNSTSSRISAPAITVRKGGILCLNAGALEMLGEDVTHVHIGYDEKRGAIGLRSAPEGTVGRYCLRTQTKSKSRLVDVKRLFALHDLEADKARSYTAEDFGDGIVGLTLKSEAEPEPSEAPEKAKAKSPRRKS